MLVHIEESSKYQFVSRINNRICYQKWPKENIYRLNIPLRNMNYNYKTSIAPISSKRTELSGAPRGGVGQTHSPGTMRSSSRNDQKWKVTIAENEINIMNIITSILLLILILLTTTTKMLMTTSGYFWGLFCLESCIKLIAFRNICGDTWSHPNINSNNINS